MATKPKFPSRIFVIRETEQDGSTYFVTFETIDEIPEDQADSLVATYALDGAAKRFRVAKALD